MGTSIQHTKLDLRHRFEAKPPSVHPEISLAWVNNPSWLSPVDTAGEERGRSEPESHCDVVQSRSILQCGRSSGLGHQTCICRVCQHYPWITWGCASEPFNSEATSWFKNSCSMFNPSFPCGLLTWKQQIQSELVYLLWPAARWSPASSEWLAGQRNADGF